MEPLLPPSGGKFESVAVGLHREAGALAATAHPVTRMALAKLVRVVNSFHSNLIEGIRTSPAEIEAALKADYSHDAGRAAAQRFAAAHFRVEHAVMTELAANPRAEVTTPAFILRLHRDLYADVPDSERIVRSPSGRTAIVIPGAIRDQSVIVGRHVAPPADSVMTFLERFHEAYRPDAHTDVGRVVAFAASHHRLAWIHPFLDGNGRVTRLMSTAYSRRIQLDANGLWSIARGFARYRSEYYAALAAADEPRRSDVDGRGQLSLSALEAWCEFVVRVALDQILYMRSLLRPDSLVDRLRGYVAYQAARGGRRGGGGGRRWRDEAGDLLAALVARGTLTRAEALRYLPGKERTAREALSVLLTDGILEADSHRAPVRLGFPPHAAQVLFTDLMTSPASTLGQPDDAPQPAVPQRSSSV
ncbi:MAG: Fic family protein [Gemmatimonadaceae bacterium]